MASLPAAPSFSASSVRREVLDNGLTILVQADPLLPILSYVTTYKVGSRNERPGITGISHLFEHMMFNGAKKFGPKQFDRVIESNGGYSNAYTTHDITSYQDIVPSDKLDVVLDLEADRMRDLDLSERMLSSEREVVKEERRTRTDESPIGALFEHLYAGAYLAHPYRWPVIGWMADIDAISVQDIQDYFRLHYQPANAVVALCGAIDPERAIEQVARRLGDLPSPGVMPGPVVRSEPPQRGERRIVLRKEAQLVTFLEAYHAVPADSSDLHVLDIIQAILADGDSSRLRRRLVLEDDLAVDVHVDFPWMMDSGLFVLSTTVRPEADAARVQAVLDEELARFVSEPPDANELRKAKNQLQADCFRRLKTTEGRADMLAMHEVLFGNHAALFDTPAKFEAVTIEDVVRVASSVLRPDNRTVAWLDPIASSDAGDDAGGDADDGDAHDVGGEA